MRNVLAHVSRGQHTIVIAVICEAFYQPDRIQACETWVNGVNSDRPIQVELITTKPFMNINIIYIIVITIVSGARATFKCDSH